MHLLGIDWNGPLPDPSDENSVIVDVDPPPQVLTDQDYQELLGRVDPLDPNSQYGIELYIESVEFVLSKLHG